VRASRARAYLPAIGVFLRLVAAEKSIVRVNNRPKPLGWNGSDKRPDQTLSDTLTIVGVYILIVPSSFWLQFQLPEPCELLSLQGDL
jgi:hypothetical protein